MCRDCNCHEEEVQIIMLYDEDGEVLECEVIATLEVDGNEYAVLVESAESDKEEVEEALVFRVEQDEEGNDILVGLEDEELEKVIKEYDRLCEELED